MKKTVSYTEAVFALAETTMMESLNDLIAAEDATVAASVEGYVTIRDLFNVADEDFMVDLRLALQNYLDDEPAKNLRGVF